MTRPACSAALGGTLQTADRGTCRHRAGGFTLVELLVALAAMALLSAMAWRGIDAMGRAQSSTQAFGADVQALQAGLGQWTSDLDAVAVMPALTPIDFDGRVLRITRRWPYEVPGSAADSAGGGLRVVAWGLRDVDGRRQWSRWQSGLLRSRTQWTDAWQQAAWWGQNPTEQLRQGEVLISGADEWQVFYFRNNSWTSPLSSAADGVAAGANEAPLPDGVRLILALTPGQAVSGRLTRDWVRPTLGPGGS